MLDFANLRKPTLLFTILAMSTIRYILSTPELPRPTLRVQVYVPAELNPNGDLTFVLPKWRPGRYTDEDYMRYFLGVRVVNKGDYTTKLLGEKGFQVI